MCVDRKRVVQYKLSSKCSDNLEYLCFSTKKVVPLTSDLLLVAYNISPLIP